ncbi:selenocysteine-specific translation elongation factor [Erwinia sp. V90_4]|uniref:selenocysteine-specific translation elongation factor n=1 Tax=Erwinia sp. V90_4 TaxID=3044239 RepID=UPI00249DAB2E|nr:selenocysteine-specific translation elongation factor [Erwinia sp. V90_4]MDI3440704.1 selenocysteine-specific translation elongation factor [Erwinia sp. V90_4]
MIIATAGHVDHGKTSLLQAITGINADRLPEEKVRGMTIDLGYAYWPQPDGQVIGFIDVPGHEKFLANMLSGIGGIDRALLVVAADDGVMPQTREHLAILQLSGQPALTVAITKCDSVDDARRAGVEQQIRQLTQELGWQQIALFSTSIHSQAGISELSDHLRQLPARTLETGRRFRLAIDRVFNVKGAGVVVTGTALGGSVSVGDALWLSGMNKAVRVRGLHAQNQPTERAQAGQRIALNLSGGVEKERVTRGDWLLSDAPAQPCDRLLVALTLHHALRQGQPLHLHHAASHITGRISLLQDNLAELLLDTPLWLTDNDRLILRDISARETLGAARVLLLTPPKRGKRQPAFIRWLKQLENADSAVEKVTLLLEQRPRTAEELEWLLQLSPGALSEVLTAVAPDIAGDYLLPQKDARQWQTELLVALENYHNEHDDRPGIGRDRLRRIALPNLPESLVLALIATLLDKQALRNNHGWLHLPDFEIGFDDREDALWQQVRPLFGDQAWWVRDLAAQAGCEEAPMRQLLRKAAQGGEIVAIVKDRYFAQPQIVRFADIIRERAASALSTSAADFRDRLGVGRKLAVQILEFFDRCGFTRRKGNEHLLRDGQMFR